MHSKTRRAQKHLTIKSGYAGWLRPARSPSIQVPAIKSRPTTTSPHPPSYFRSCSGSRECHRVAL
jgi:hypothetical protein